MASTQKRKRVSKKNKKSWRKNVDVTDVDNFLEDQRLEERLGRNLQQQSDNDLFSIDTTGEDTATSNEKPVNQRSLRLKEFTTPKCYAILEKRSAVPDPLVKRNHLKVKEKIRKTKPTSGKIIKRKLVDDNKLDKTKFRSIWNETNKTRELNGYAEWISPDAVRHVLQNTGSKMVKPRNPKKPSPLSAVEAPHPGMSYNPTLKDHQELLHAIVAVEAETEKKEKHLERVTTKMFKKIPREQAEKEYIQEMSVGLQESSDSSEEEGDYTTVNPPVERKKKTLKERRKAREARERQRLIEAQKLEKKKRADVNERLKKLEKHIEKKEELSSKYQERKKERKQKKEYETKILGKTRFEAPLLEFKSPNELRGSLRQLEPTGSVLKDRFYSLQKRNFIEPTLKRNIRKAKVKRIVKNSHKMGWEPKGY